MKKIHLEEITIDLMKDSQATVETINKNFKTIEGAINNIRDGLLSKIDEVRNKQTKLVREVADIKNNQSKDSKVLNQLKIDITEIKKLIIDGRNGLLQG